MSSFLCSSSSRPAVRPSAHGLVLIGLGLFASAGCRQIVGITDCGTCTDRSCAAEQAACQASPLCSELEDCLALCRGDPACRSKCVIDHPIVSGLDAPANLEACLASQCSAACGLTCGVLSKISSPKAAPSCSSCIQRHDNICSDAETCARNPDCQRELLCREGCVTGDCTGACTVPGYDGTQPLCLGSCGPARCLTPCATADSHVSLYSMFFGHAGTCQQECEIGNNWSCVGHVEWPAAKGPTRKLTLALVDALDMSQPATAATVKLCSEVGKPCKELDENVTNDQGVVTLVDASQVLGGIALNGYLEVSSPDLYPTIIQWGFPLSEPHGILSTPIPVFSSFDLNILLGGDGPSDWMDPTRAMIAVGAVDCLGDNSSGVRFSADGLGADFLLTYLKQPPSLTGPTDQTGAAIFSKVSPPGPQDIPISISATPDALLGKKSSVQTVGVRAGWLTEVLMMPTP
jgi:hypothetical protein